MTNHQLPPLPDPASVKASGYDAGDYYSTDQIKSYASNVAEYQRIGLLEWAVSRWRAEVENRPIKNIHRRSLDDVWRQVIRYAGGDPNVLIGPSHDVLLAMWGVHE